VSEALMPHVMKSLNATMARALGAGLARLPTPDVEMLARHACTTLRGRPKDALVLFSRAVRDFEAGAPSTFADSGESQLLDRLRGQGFRTLFDVGANLGAWSRHAAHCFPQAQIHAFEIVPATFRKLRAAVEPLGRAIHLNAFGLSDHDGEIEVYLGSSDAISSVYRFRETAGEQRTRCAVRTGDSYAEEHGIETIDLLKIDVEGGEGAVLRGLRRMLERRAIRMIQFEYNRGAIESRFLLLDFYRLLEPHGYRLGRLRPDGVTFHDYEYAHEDFNGPNYVACQAAESRLMEAVSVPS
jgi:FkbM family methyltransferase